MADTLNFDQLIIDRPLDMFFEDSNGKLLAVLDQLSSLSLNESADTRDKTDANGALLKRYYTAKQVEVSGENAVFSMNLHGLQTGSEIITGENVVLPRIMLVNATDSPYDLPDTPIDGTLIVYGTHDNGVPDLAKRYTKGTTAAAGVYAIATDETTGVTTITLPTDATDIVEIKYEYQVTEDKTAARVDNYSDIFPKQCKATARVLCSDICDSEVTRALYIVFPKFQMAPDFDWTLDTESTQNFSAQALKDYCAKKQLLYYIAIAEDSNLYDVAKYNNSDE